MTRHCLPIQMISDLSDSTPRLRIARTRKSSPSDDAIYATLCLDLAGGTSQSTRRPRTCARRSLCSVCPGRFYADAWLWIAITSILASMRISRPDGKTIPETRIEEGAIMCVSILPDNYSTYLTTSRVSQTALPVSVQTGAAVPWCYASCIEYRIARPGLEADVVQSVRRISSPFIES